MWPDFSMHGWGRISPSDVKTGFMAGEGKVMTKPGEVVSCVKSGTQIVIL
jgi:hypothetical protein